MPGNQHDLARREWLTRAFALAAGVLIAPAAHAASLAVGAPAPPLTLHTIDGRALRTSDFAGQVLIVTFWATWCAPCLEELPLLSRYVQSHAADGIAVMAFSLDAPENLPAVRDFARTLAFPVGLLGNPWAGGYGRIWRCPVSFTIDRAGRLADNGWDDDQPTWTAEKLETLVTPLLRRNR